MKYEIITDHDDLLVLTVNSRVIEISNDMSTIVDKLADDYKEFMVKKKKTVEKVLNKDIVVETPVIGGELDKEPNAGSLGKLFNLG